MHGQIKRKQKDVKKILKRNYKEGFTLENNSPRAKLQRNFERLYKKGLSDDAIAKELKISSGSVRNYRENLLGLESNYNIKKKPAVTGKNKIKYSYINSIRKGENQMYLCECGKLFEEPHEITEDTGEIFAVCPSCRDKL